MKPANGTASVFHYSPGTQPSSTRHLYLSPPRPLFPCHHPCYLLSLHSLCSPLHPPLLQHHSPPPLFLPNPSAHARLLCPPRTKLGGWLKAEAGGGRNGCHAHRASGKRVAHLLYSAPIMCVHTCEIQCRSIHANMLCLLCSAYH